LQGFVVKDYFSNALKDPKVADPIQVVLAACIIETLAITWWLIMECFRSYNKIRIDRLRKIEDALSTKVMDENLSVVEQYKFHYLCFPSPKSEKQDTRGPEPLTNQADETKDKGFKVRFHDIYFLILALISIINALLVYTAYRF
jgi:hypothetical protein